MTLITDSAISQYNEALDEHNQITHEQAVSIMEEDKSIALHDLAETVKDAAINWLRHQHRYSDYNSQDEIVDSDAFTRLVGRTFMLDLKAAIDKY